MQHIIKKYIFFIAMIVLLSDVNATENPSTAFYYAKNPPLDLLSSYERVVVEPENISPEQLNYMQKRGVSVYAYLSIGEVSPTRDWYDQINKKWIKGENIDWGSVVMDMTSTGWHDFLLNKKIQKFWQQGYRGFFLDTMDSYQLFAKNETEQSNQQRGMVKLLKKMKKKYKNIHLLFNRGFEILDQTADLSDGLIAESLFSGWDSINNEYKSINAKEREWLLSKLQQVKDKYALPITVIDYLPPEQRIQAEKVAKKIRQAGFSPWVSTPELNYMGVGSRKLIPRKVLFIYDSREEGLAYALIHRFLAMPLEYLGYIPDYWDIAKGLPNDILKGRYAGIVTWLSGLNPTRDKPLANWVHRQVQHKLPIAFIGGYPLISNQQLSQYLKLEFHEKNLIAPLDLSIHSEHLGFEAKPVTRYVGLPLIYNKAGNNWLTITDTNNKKITPIFTSSWGGVALNPYVLQTVPPLGNDDEFSRWVINPFKFLKIALQLKSIPVPDLTTENGNRILTLHIDGDGFYNKSQLPGHRYASEVILDQFLKPYTLPHTVSIIEGEIGEAGLKPELSSVLKPIAQKIFKLPNIEIASHSFSHPFDWYQAAAQVTTEKNKQTGVADNDSKRNLKSVNKQGSLLTEDNSYSKRNKTVFKADDSHFHLPILNYSYSAKREIKGSINYIDKILAPSGKKTKVFLWTGNCLPNEEALAWTKKMQVANLNGGDTMIRNGINSMTNVSSSGIVRGPYFQPFAPIQNENVYTNDWTGPFYGYQRVIETFKLTDQPKRLKPISIYYHFYSGERQASLRALKRVYDWTLAQETLPMWLSEYIPRVNAFRNAVYEQVDGGWKIHQAKDLHTLRIAEPLGLPDIENSEGVAGYRKISQGQYIALNGDDVVTIRLTNQPNQVPHLIQSNARIRYWKKSKRSIDFRLAGHQPVMFILSNLSHRCRLKNKSGKEIKATKKLKLKTIFKFKKHDTGALRLVCEK